VKLNLKKYLTDAKVEEKHIRSLYAHCEDVKIIVHSMGNPSIPILLIYSDYIVDKKQMNDIILPRLQEMMMKKKEKDGSWDQEIEWTKLEAKNELNQVSLEIFDGNLVLFFLDDQAFYSVSVSNKPNRSPEDSNYEVSIRGPRDSFVEDISTNVALIRKRLRHPSLSYQTFTIGERTQTKIGLLYLEDVVNMNILGEIRHRLSNISLDGITSTTQVQEIIADQSLSIFPLTGDTTRPDFAVDCLLQGRFILVVDGNPLVIIAPVTISFLVKSAEDTHFSYLPVSLGRLFRYSGFLIAIYLPGFWIALLAYHQDQIPFTLLATVTMARLGLPFPAPLELFIVLFLLELFREAGQRLPSPIGQTLSVVGGLIIGDAAIRAGFISPSVIVITALSAIAGYTLVNQVLLGAVSVMRAAVVIASSVLGLFGFFIAGFAITLHLARLRSFGIPYLVQVNPQSVSDVLKALFRFPWKFIFHRPVYMQNQNTGKRKEGKK